MTKVTTNMLAGGGSAGQVLTSTGAASALPATPFTYLQINIDGTNYKIPVYNN